MYHFVYNMTDTKIVPCKYYELRIYYYYVPVKYDTRSINIYIYMYRGGGKTSSCSGRDDNTHIIAAPFFQGYVGGHDHVLGHDRIISTRVYSPCIDTAEK